MKQPVLYRGAAALSLLGVLTALAVDPLAAGGKVPSVPAVTVDGSAVRGATWQPWPRVKTWRPSPAGSATSGSLP